MKKYIYLCGKKVSAIKDTTVLYLQRLNNKIIPIISSDCSETLLPPNLRRIFSSLETIKSFTQKTGDVRFSKRKRLTFHEQRNNPLNCMSVMGEFLI